VSNWKEYRAPSNYVYGQPPQDLSQLILTDLWAKNGLEEKYGNIIESFERLNSDDLKEVLDMIRSDHQIQTVLNTLSRDRKSTRLNSSHVSISYAVFCLKKKN